MYVLREYRLLGLSRVGGISLFELHLRKELLVEPKTVKMQIFQFMILFLPANEHKAIHISSAPPQALGFKDGIRSLNISLLTSEAHLNLF